MTGIFNSIIDEIAKSENISEIKLNALKFALEIAAKIEEKDDVSYDFYISEFENGCQVILAAYYWIGIEHCYKIFGVNFSVIKDNEPSQWHSSDYNQPKKISFFQAKSAEDDVWAFEWFEEKEEGETEIDYSIFFEDDIKNNDKISPADAFIKAANYLNKCPSNPQYEALTDEKIIAELKKFKYGENELTPLQFAYLHFLPSTIKLTLQYRKSLKNPVYAEGYDEESYVQIFKEFRGYLTDFLKYGLSYSYEKACYEYFQPYMGATTIDIASIGKFLELFIPYYEQVSRAKIAEEKKLNFVDDFD